MNCEETRVLIHARLDGRLAAGDGDKLEIHLSGCDNCSAYAKTFAPLKRRVSVLAGSMDTSTAAAALDRVLNSPAAGRSLARRFLPLPPAKFKFTYAAAAVVVVAAAIFVAMSSAVPAYSLASTVVREHDLFADGKMPLDTRASCCDELEKWYENAVGNAVHVPEIAYEGISVEGGKLYREADLPQFFCAAYRVDGKPVTLYVICHCDGDLPDGEEFAHNGRQARVAYDGRHTIISWRQGGTAYILVTSFDRDKSRAIFASVN